jgi:multidrug efflux pump subunit AcrA (membrane-fusion protein)
VKLKIDNKNIDSALLIPITSVKFTASDGSVFTIENGHLKALPISIGEIRGNLIEINEGIEADTLIVKDARGLSEGQRVTTE